MRTPGWGTRLPPVFICLLLLIPAACRKESPEEAISKIRRGYEVKLNSWNHREGVIFLDIFVTRTTKKSLPGITAELYHFDSRENQKAIRYIFIDTSRITYGYSSQITVRIEDLEVLEGDGLGLKYFYYPTPEQMTHYREYKESPS